MLHYRSCLALNQKERPITGAKADAIIQKLHFFYHLKRYKKKPSPLFKKRLDHYFDQICDLKTDSPGFDQALSRMYLNRRDLLKVFDNPWLCLHNNLSKNDLRGYVVRRKLSGGTRSELGKRTRDLFYSLIKTCLKLGISFWTYLKDRIWGIDKIPPLSQMIRQKALLTSTF